MITYFYPQTIRNITVALLDMFNDIHVHRRDAYPTSATVVKDIAVPIQFGPIEKAQMDRKEGHYYDNDNIEHGDRFYLQVPRMALIMTGISYNASRAAGVNEWRYWVSETLNVNEDVFADYQPTPYDYNFSLYVRTDTMDDFSQIMENILPYFNPKLMLRLKEFSFLNIERDLPVSVDGIVPEFTDDMNNEDTRHINAVLNLTVEGFMYRPWTTSKIINQIDSRYFVTDYITSGAPSTVLVTDYSTSGFDATETSAFSALALDTSAYSFSGLYTPTDMQWFTSATPHLSATSASS